MADFSIRPNPRPSTLTRHNDTYPFISPLKFTGKLQEKVVLITGISRGIGRATTFALAAAGASIAGISRTASELESLEAEIKLKHNVPMLFLARDVLDDPAKLVADVERELGPIDILINNAGIARLGHLYLEKDIDLWWHVLEVNVKGPMALIHACLPGMMSRGNGKVITLSSAASDYSFPYVAGYSALKAALQKAHESLESEMRGKGIVFYCIHPGGTAKSPDEVGRNFDAVNMDSMMFPEVQEWLKQFGARLLTDTLEMAADSIVFLAVDKRMEVFSGRYFDCCRDMEEVLENKDRILSEDLHKLNVKLL